MLIALGIAIFLIIFIIFFIWLHSLKLSESSADALIILGYSCKDDKLHPFLEERLKSALKLLEKSEYKKIIVTGGNVKSKRPESDIMQEYLIRRGVDEKKILIENKAMDTIENIRNIKEIMEKESLSSCIIVSSSFHLRRVKYITKKMGMCSCFYADRRVRILKNQASASLNEIKAFNITYSLLKNYNYF